MMKTTPSYYRVYGLGLRSAIPLPCAAVAEHASKNRPSRTTTQLVKGSASFFARARRRSRLAAKPACWFDYAALPEGGAYLRWSGLFEFVISPAGRRIACRALNGTSLESFQTYLVSQVLSFALTQQGVEPLHSTVVDVAGRAAAFLGDCGYGKSSLGAAFLREGHVLLTDDLLALQPKGRRFLAHPGPPQIKLFPEIARTLLGDWAEGVPMNHQTSKVIVPLPPRLTARQPRPLGAIYVLKPPAAQARRERISIRTLSPRRACLALIANTFNPVVMEPARLARQFHWAARVADGVPVKTLSYPRDLTRLPEIVDAIRADLA